MITKYFSLTTLTLALAALLGLSSLGSAITLDVAGVAHMPWTPLSNYCAGSIATLPVSVGGTVKVESDINGAFIATVTTGTTIQSYSLNPANLSTGWKAVVGFTPALPSTSIQSLFNFTFGFGPNNISLPYDSTTFCPLYFGNSAQQFLFYQGNIFLCISGTPNQYGISPWPVPPGSSFGSITTNDTRMPSFLTFEILDNEASNGTLFIARCLETKSNQYYSMIIDANSKSPWMEMTDLIAQDKNIISFTGSNDGSRANADTESFLAIADDGSTYYCPSTEESASAQTSP